MREYNQARDREIEEVGGGERGGEAVVLLCD